MDLDLYTDIPKLLSHIINVGAGTKTQYGRPRQARRMRDHPPPREQERSEFPSSSQPVQYRKLSRAFRKLCRLSAEAQLDAGLPLYFSFPWFTGETQRIGIARWCSVTGEEEGCYIQCRIQGFVAKLGI